MASSSSSDKLEELIIRLTNQQLTLTNKIDDLLQHVSPSSPQPPPYQPPLHRPFHNPTPAQNHRLKLDVPHFDGTDPFGWIFKIQQFFEYHGTLEYDRLTIASFYMEGRALA